MLILYNPPSSAQRKPILPMSLLALGALLEDTHDYRIVDGNLERDTVAAVDRAIRETGADILGVTVMPGPQLSDAVPLCRHIKAMHPRLTIVWGGYFPTQHYEVCLESGYVDYVVRGHGEVIFKSLIDALRRGADPSGLFGLAYRHPHTGEVVSNPLAPIPHPEHLPDFPYHRIDVPRYVRRTFMGSRTLPHHSSYGCPFFCNFCAVVNMVNGRWLAQSAERAANTVRVLVEQFGVDSVEFDDNNFFTHEARTAEFAGRIMDLGIGWWGEARIDTLMHYSDRTWALMRDSGLKMAFLGAESGSDETLQRMNKGGKASTEKTLEIAARMKHYGIVPEMSFVLGNPPDPESDVRQTIEFIRKLKRVNPSIEIILYMYTPVPLAGELYEQAKAVGFAFPATLDEWINPAWREFSQRRSTNVPWLKDPVRRKIRDFQWVINAYYPTITDTNLSKMRRSLLRALSAWRYHLRLYRYPIELRAFQKFLAYQRPETSGF
ncbi:MAG TPA: radical SAM protein [Anaerolineae bacterium]